MFNIPAQKIRRRDEKNKNKKINQLLYVFRSKFRATALLDIQKILKRHIFHGLLLPK